MFNPGLKRLAKRALDRQLEYQQRKALKIRGDEEQVIARMIQRSTAVRDKLQQVQPLPADARVLEVGSGAHGLIFYFDAAIRVGVDPLADHYARLFPAWQGRVETVAAGGEKLPFHDSSFDVVLCDNVVDHAEGPRQIVREISRVLAPGGLLYFTVNVHHPFYHLAASAHAAWRAAGVPIEITPFADHTVHLTLPAARRLFEGTPLHIVSEFDTVHEVKRGGAIRIRHMGDHLKRLFFKNALYEVIAVRESN